MRHDGRNANQFRPIEVVRRYTRPAAGSEGRVTVEIPGRMRGLPRVRPGDHSRRGRE